MPTSDIKKGPLYVDSTNNRVGVGTSTPTSIVHTEENTTGASIVRHKNTSNTSGAHSRLIIQNGGTSGGDTLINLDSQTSGSRFTLGVDNSANKFVIANADKGSFDGSNEAMVITSGGNVGIGQSSPNQKLDVNGNIVTDSYSLGAGNGIFLRRGYETNAQPSITVEDHNGSAPDGLGVNGWDGVSFRTTGTERMRIKADGEINIGGEDYTDAHLNVRHNGGGSSGWQGAAIAVYGAYGGKISFVDNSDLASSGSGYSLYTSDNGNDFYVQGNTNSTTNSGGVYLNDRATSWSSASDERQKENLVDITGALDDLATLRTVKGNYIWSPNQTKAFLIAQDVQAILPEAVSIQNKNDDAEDQRLGLDYNQMIPLLVAALNEAKTKIETLETNQAALETRIAALEAN